MGEIDKGEQVVCIVTGHLLKDPNTAINACIEPIEIEANIEALSKIINRLIKISSHNFFLEI